MPFKYECEILLYPNLPKKLYTTLVYVKNPNGKTYVYSNISIYDKETKKAKHIRLLLLVLPAGRQSATETVSVHITITVRSLGTNCTRTRNIPSPHGKDIVFISTSYYDKFLLVHETPVRASGLSTMASIMILI